MGELQTGCGTVKFFNDQKGYGFIKLENDDEVFVHQTKIKMEGHRTLYENQPCNVVYYSEEKGLKADSVEPDMKWVADNPEQCRRRDDRGGGYGGGRDRDNGGRDRDYGYGNRSYDSRGGGYGGGGGGGGYDRGYGGGGGGYGGGSGGYGGGYQSHDSYGRGY